MVGANDGLFVAGWVGELEGISVGDVEGIAVGDCDGAFVGGNDGELDGLTEEQMREYLLAWYKGLLLVIEMEH